MEEIPPGHVLFREVHSQPVVLVNLKGKIYAFEGLSPHQQKPLCGASLWDDLLECPWHHFQFKVETSENYYPRNLYPKSDPRLQRQLAPLKNMLCVFVMERFGLDSMLSRLPMRRQKIHLEPKVSPRATYQRGPYSSICCKNLPANSSRLASRLLAVRPRAIYNTRKPVPSKMRTVLN